jgi:hypothetical protein
MRTRKFAVLARMMVILTAVAGTTLVGASAAQAWPSGCASYLDLDAGYSYCSGGTGKHRISIQCQGPVARIYWATGPWATSGHYSWAFCDHPWPIDTTTGRYSLTRTAS